MLKLPSRPVAGIMTVEMIDKTTARPTRIADSGGAYSRLTTGPVGFIWNVSNHRSKI
jgi:hypothetical protein